MSVVPRSTPAAGDDATSAARQEQPLNEGLETVHVVFGWSIAHTLRKALPLLGSTERVIALPEILSIGPIDTIDPHVRHAWARSVLRADVALRDELDGDPIDGDSAWAAATSPDVAPVYWACLTSPTEHACFLAYAARMHERCFQFIDATDLAFTTLDGVESPWTLALLRDEDIAASRLHATRRPISAAELQAASRTWAALRRDNAPFRIVSDGRLVSAPITHYDALLVETANQGWEIAVQVIGRAIATLASNHAWRGQANGDAVLFGRMLALADEGMLEIAGPGPGMRDYRVRTAIR